MSLVERALKKLQESRGAAAPVYSRAVAPQSAAVPRPTTPVTPAVAASPALEPHVHTDPYAKPEPPTRIVPIDKKLLCDLQLLPPPAFERQIASQYQHVKRPLVAAALGKSSTPVANGCLIMLASALPGEGKTFTSINLALSMALEKDIEVLLVDADVAKPHLTRLFKLQSERGLLDLLDDASLHAGSLVLPTDVPGLSILPAGKQVSNATELLSSARMEQVVAQLGASPTPRIVLFDSPPLLLSTESRAIAEVVGQVVLVVRAESTSRAAVADAIDLIGEHKSLSLILNQSESPPSSGYYGYGSYGDNVPPAADR
jgi:protein-tyrosine kinase